MICEDCGKEIEENVKACPHCGSSKTKLDGEKLSNNFMQKKKRLYWTIGTICCVAMSILVLACFHSKRQPDIRTSSNKSVQPAIAAGGTTAYYLSSSGQVWTWGGGENGELGNATITSIQTVPVLVSNLTHVVSIAAGEFTGLALDSSGRVWAWGNGFHGELGNGALTEHQTTPVQVSGLQNIVAIADGETTGYALDKSGHVWAWGDGQNGELGNGITGNQITRDSSGNGVYGTTTPVQVSNLSNIVAISASGVDGYALDSSGHIWAWGDGKNSELGNGTIGGPIGMDSRKNVNYGTTTPVQVSNISNISAIFTGGLGTACALDSSGQIWAWGNADGSLFNGSRTDPTAVPVQVSTPSHIVSVVGGTFTSYALDSSGQVWACGDGTFGELGNKQAGLNASMTSPVLVSNLSNIIAIASGNLTGYALDSSFSVWAWGDGKNGELGNGTTGSLIGKGYYGNIYGSTTPVQVLHLP